MDIGMLWYDDDHKRPLNERVSKAVDYYKGKYGVVPTVCFINPATLKDGPEMAAGVQLRAARNVLIDHFWLGIGETAAPRASSNGKTERARGGSAARTLALAKG
jgi:hypothetical protein